VTTVADRRRGCLYGLAVGDALGAAVEFMEPGSFEPVIGYRGGGPHRLAPGEWTDDTSMALALADSIGDGWNLDDQTARYLLWYRFGKYSVNGQCFDIGMTTSRGLRRFESGTPAAESGDPSETASGNGSIMRLAPVPIANWEWLETDPDRLIARLRESSLPTHRSVACQHACAYLGLLLAGLIAGYGREQILDPGWRPVADRRDRWHPQIAEVATGSFRSKQPPQIRGSGWVVESLEAALWAFAAASDFEDAVLVAVNLGNDADTTGAVCGQLAGACFGQSGIPEHLRSGLARSEMIDTALSKLGV